MGRVEVLRSIKKKEDEIEARRAAARQKAERVILEARDRANQMMAEAQKKAEEEHRKIVGEAKERVEQERKERIEHLKKSFSSSPEEKTRVDSSARQIVEQFIKHIRSM